MNQPVNQEDPDQVIIAQPAAKRYAGQADGPIALACGLIGLFIAPVGIVALVLGLRARRESQQSGLPLDSLVVVGYILGIITTVLLAAAVLLFIIVLLVLLVIALVGVAS